MTNAMLQEAAAVQAAPDIARGLPYWLFWFLLCVILLLLATIFLRDKDLRRRMSAFLSGTRRRMLSLRLQTKLSHEKEKKAALWRELGRRGWSEDVAANCVAEDCRKLAGLEEERHARQMAWHEIYSRIEALGRDHEREAGRVRDAVKEQEDLRRPVEEERRSLGSRKSEILDAIGGAAWEVDSDESQLKALDREARAVEGNAKLPGIEKAERLNRIQEKAAALAGRIRALQEKLPLLHEERKDLEQLQAQAEARAEVFGRRIAEARGGADGGRPPPRAGAPGMAEEKAGRPGRDRPPPAADGAPLREHGPGPRRGPVRERRAGRGLFRDRRREPDDRRHRGAHRASPLGPAPPAALY